MFLHQTVRQIVQEAMRDVNKLSNPEYNEYRTRKDEVDRIKNNLFKLLKADEELTAVLERVLRELK